MNNSEVISGFEGAEKILHVKITSPKPNNGLLSIPQSKWSEILTVAKCTILSRICTEKTTAYILSESSLFVTDSECIFKTCGRTVLLFALPLVLDLLKEMGLKLEFLLYSSKDFLFPKEQLFPHGDWKDAEQYLQSFFPDEHCTILGNATQDNVFLFTVTAIPLPELSLCPHIAIVNKERKHCHEMIEPSSPCSVNYTGLCEGGLESCYLNMMMYDMNEEIAKQFYSRAGVTAKMVTKESGIESIFADALIDDFLFEPCGYSMNGLAEGGFFTIHITPEAHCSYASFETNIVVSDYTKLIQSVLRVFRPKRFCMTFFNHRDLQSIAEDNPLENNTFVAVSTGEVYSRVEYVGVEKDNSIYRIGNYANLA